MKQKEVWRVILVVGLFVISLLIIGCNSDEGTVPGVDLTTTCKAGFEGWSTKVCDDPYGIFGSQICKTIKVPALNFAKNGLGIRTVEVDGTTHYVANFYVLGQDAFLLYNDPSEGNTVVTGIPENHLALCYKSKKGTIYTMDYGWDLDMDLVGDSQLSFLGAPPTNSKEVINYLETKYNLKKDCQDYVGVKNSFTENSIKTSINFNCLAEKQINFPVSCSNLVQCKTYCSAPENSNQNICTQIKSIQFKIPDKCEDTNECITYCTKNPAECESYAKTNGCLTENLYEVATFSSEDEPGCPSVLVRGEYNDVICKLPQMSHCSFCIHPNVLWDKEIKGGVEVCGDGIDNDCNSDTNDDCDLFKEGCEQSESLLIDNPEEVTPENTPVSGEGTAPPAPASTANTHYNIFDQKFSWIPTAEGGYCCGYNGIKDLGVIKDGAEIETKAGTVESAPGSYACLKKDLTGSKDESIPDELCGKDWCWVSASTGAPAGGQLYK